MSKLNALAFYINTQLRKSLVQTIYLTNLFCVSIQNRFSTLLCLFLAYISSHDSLVVLWQSFLSLFSPFRKPSIIDQCSLVVIVRHIFGISDDSRMRITKNDLPTSKSKMEDDFSFRYATELYSIALSGCT